jgi:protein SCO1/2
MHDRNSMIRLFVGLALVTLAATGPAIGQGTGLRETQDATARKAPAMPRVDPSKVGLDQKRGEQVPLDMPFLDETGKAVKFGDYFHDKPVILNMIFYKCPGVCMAELEGMTKLFRDNELSQKAGQDFEVVTVSINPKETPQLAADKKREFMDLLGDKGVGAGWHFLTGQDPAIKALAAAVGFRYVYDPPTDQFAHPAGIMVLTPEGKVSHYFYGINYQPRDIRFSLIEASKGRIGSLADKIVLNCMYQYDPKTGRYGLAIVRALQFGGILTLITLVTSIVVMSRVYNRQMDRWEKQQALKEAENAVVTQGS